MNGDEENIIQIVWIVAAAAAIVRGATASDAAATADAVAQRYEGFINTRERR